MSGPHLLIADDDDNLRSMLAAALRHTGFDVTAVSNGREVLNTVGDVQPDLIVLDVMMPELDGFDTCKRLRQDGYKTPILFLTAKDRLEDKVEGLTLGGDDYLNKPFAIEELAARVTAILRRTGAAVDDSTIALADLVIDDDAHRVTRGGDEITLSPTEYNLLKYLMSNQGRVLSKAQILDNVWHYDFGGEGGIVETYVGYLRKKIDDREPKLIHTIRGVGYTMRLR